MTKHVSRCLLFLLVLCNHRPLDAAQTVQKIGKPAATKVRISQSAVSARSTILWTAQELGLFAKHGVEVEAIYLRTSPLQM
ncbi:MAG TPA: hypothetical protein VGK57_12530, partial [Candidatus Binatia bacterium]